MRHDSHGLGDGLGEDDKRQESARLVSDALAGAMPRALIAEGRAERLAADWIARVDRAIAAGFSPFPRYPLDSSIREGLFEVRQSRQVVRGLEGAESALAMQDLGLSKAVATRPESDRRRVSRLLVVSADGSGRFYHGVGRLRERYFVRLEVVLIECDEMELGGATFGEGRRARALMINHKLAVARFLTRLDEFGDSPLTPTG